MLEHGYCRTLSSKLVLNGDSVSTAVIIQLSTEL